MLILLTLIYAVNIADRYVISTLIEPIKADLHLSDTSIGFLTGVALAIFYVTAGLPLGVLADRASRRNLLAASLAVWSVMTTICGFTQTFWQLLLARVGVGVGEAGGTPPSNALISDYFPWRRRPLALSIFSLGASLGSMIGTSAGYVSDAWGWRSAFLLLGTPGIVLAAIVILTLKEPQRGRLDSTVLGSRTSLLDTLRYARGAPALVHCLAGATVFTLWGWGLMWWAPSYLVRSHGMTLGAAGGALSLMNGIGGTAVLLGTTVLMGRLAGRDARVVPWFVMTTIIAGTFPSIVAFSTTSTHLTLVMLWLFIPLTYAAFGPTFALLQNLVPPGMRAQSIALLLFFSNIANLVIAPQLVGIVSDHFAARYGTESLRVALIPLAFVGFWAAWHYWRCARHLRAGLQLAGIPSAEPPESAQAAEV